MAMEFSRKSYNEKKQVKVRKIGLVLVLQWLLMILFTLVFLGFLFSGKLMVALLSFLIVVMLYPNLNSFLKNHVEIELSRILRIAIIIILLFGIGFSSSQTSNTTAQYTTALITKSVDEMLPTRADIPTEFKIQGTKNVTLNEAGFDSGMTLSTDKLDGSGVIFVDYSVYKFSTTDAATSFYTNKTSTIKQEGGYTEISISGCFAYKVDMGINGEDGDSICQNNNVVYIVRATSAQTFTSIDSFMKDGTNLLNSKI